MSFSINNNHQGWYLQWIIGLLVGSAMMSGMINVTEMPIQTDDKLHHTCIPYNLTKTTTIALNSNETKKFNCAALIPPEKRKVLFVELNTWADYYGRSKFKTGEYYVSATWDYALRANGFQVDRVSTKEYYSRMKADEIMKYHRIFVRDPKQHRYYSLSKIFCRVRPMYFFGDWSYKKNDYNYRFQVPFDEKQVLSANPDSRNTFAGYFPHNLLLSDEEVITSTERGKVALLYGKKPEYFVNHMDLVAKLLSANFELHSTCKDTPQKNCSLPEEVIRHENLNPKEFAKLMRKFSLMIGFGLPLGSPSPVVGLSYGVTFLNPLRTSGGKNTQHKSLSRLGFPYVYTIDLNNHTGVLQAAEWASRFRFHSYVPPQYRVSSVVDRICNILENDTPCHNYS
jgi:hypothetical protein